MSVFPTTIKQERIVEQPDESGNIVKYKVVTTSIRTKKDVIRRRKLPKFGHIVHLDNESVTVRENKPIEIRCLPPRLVEEASEPFEIDLLLESKALARCKNCGMPGHFSLKCPKRREIEPRTPLVDVKESPEITLRVFDLPDTIYDRQFQDLVRNGCRQLGIPAGMSQIKCNVAKDANGTPNGLGYINLMDHTQEHAHALLDYLDRMHIDHNIIQAEIIASRRENRRRGPNKYDDEAAFGVSDRPWRKA